MKRIIALALTIITMLSCLFTLSSCKGTYSMYEVKNDLKNHGFNVDDKWVYESNGVTYDTISTISETTVEIDGFCDLFSGYDKKALVFKTKIDKKEYKEEVFESEEEYKHVFVAQKRGHEYVVGVFFNKRSDAKKFEDFLVGKIGEDLVDRDRKIVLFANNKLALDCAMAHETTIYKLEENIDAKFEVVSTSDKDELALSKDALKSIYNISFEGELLYAFNATRTVDISKEEFIAVLCDKKSDAKSLAEAAEGSGKFVKRDGKTVLIAQTEEAIELAYKKVNQNKK